MFKRSLGGRMWMAMLGIGLLVASPNAYSQLGKSSLPGGLMFPVRIEPRELAVDTAGVITFRVLNVSEDVVHVTLQSSFARPGDSVQSVKYSSVGGRAVSPSDSLVGNGALDSLQQGWIQGFSKNIGMKAGEAVTIELPFRAPKSLKPGKYTTWVYLQATRVTFHSPEFDINNIPPGGFQIERHFEDMGTDKAGAVQLVYQHKPKTKKK